MTVEELLAQTRQLMDEIERRQHGGKAWSGGYGGGTRTPSRFAAEGASHEHIKQLAEGGSIAPGNPARDRRFGGGVMLSKALAEATEASGGYLVQPQVAAEVLAMLRSQAVIGRLGATVLTGIAKELDVSSIASGATAYWVAENANVPVSDLTFAQAALLRPKALAAMLAVSQRLLRDAASDPNLDALLRQELAEVLGLRLDLSVIQGSGTGGEPLGIKGTSGLTSAPALAAGSQFDFDVAIDVVAAVRDQNVPMLRGGWILPSRVVNSLRKLKDGQGHYLANDPALFTDNGQSGTLLGQPWYVSGQIPTNLGAGTNETYVVYGGNWQELFIGIEQELQIALSTEASYTPDGGATWINAFQARQQLFRAEMTVDAALRRPKAFCVISGILPPV